jgi:hypothetical protein
MYRAIIVLALSIATLPITVKAQDGNSPSFKNARVKPESSFRDSISDVRNDFSKLIEIVLASGDDTHIHNGFAKAIGLPQALPLKIAHSDINHHEDNEESRECNVAYGPDDNSKKHPVCVLFSRTTSTKDTMSSRYYRVSLDGQLEHAVTLNNKRGADGNALPEGRSKSEEDINSPETQKAFKTEMTYWVKDWLKKQRAAKAETAKLPASAASERAASAPAASAATTP